MRQPQHIEAMDEILATMVEAAIAEVVVRPPIVLAYDPCAQRVAWKLSLLEADKEE